MARPAVPSTPPRRAEPRPRGALRAAVWGVLRPEADRLELPRHRLPLPGLRRPLRVAQLSDLHLGPFVPAPRVRRWTDAATAARPDLVVVTGDLVDRRRPAAPERVARALARLRPPLGVWAVWGNHDHDAYPDGPAALRAALEAAGAGVLENDGVRLRDDLWLAGVDDLRRGAPDPARALAGAPDGAARLLLAHNPDGLPALASGAAGLALCGHTHGGQICAPGVGPLVTASRHGRRFAAGFVAAPVPAYVSRGLGVAGALPLRLGCLPELPLFELRPEDAEASREPASGTPRRPL